MASGFFRTIKTLEEDRFRGTLVVLIPVAALLLAWTIWFFAAQVTLYETSTTARLEMQRQIYPVDSPVAGSVASDYLVVGANVAAGAVLVELDSQKARLELDEARAQQRDAQAAAAYSDEEARRLRQLNKIGQVAEIDYLKSSAEAKKNRAKADLLEHTIKKLEYELDRRRIRAPVAGKIGEKNPSLQFSSLVKEGDHLATLIPEGEFKVTSTFPPAAAMGRIKVGQTARLRLNGFPWAQFGSVNGVVTLVESEMRDGHIRVETSVERDPKSTIPLQHGLPGVVEIDVGRVSPAELVLRVAGGGMNKAEEPPPPVTKPGDVAVKPGEVK